MNADSRPAVRNEGRKSPKLRIYDFDFSDYEALSQMQARLL